MGHEENGGLRQPPDLRDAINEQGLVLRVEAGQRFIEDQDFGPAEERLRQHHPLPLAAGKDGKGPLRMLPRAGEFQHAVDFLPRLAGRPGNAPAFAVTDRLDQRAGAQGRKLQARISLPHVTDLVGRPSGRFIKYFDGAGQRTECAEQGPDQRGFSRAVGTENPDELPFPDLRVHPGQDFISTQGHAQVGYLQSGRHHFPSFPRLPRSQVALGNALAEAISLLIPTSRCPIGWARNKISRAQETFPNETWERGMTVGIISQRLAGRQAGFHLI